MVSVKKLHPLFVAEIAGVDLQRPLSADEIAAIKQAFVDYAVLVFPNQPLNDERQVAFSRNFGPLERMVSSGLGGPPEIANLSNVDAEGNILPPKDDRAIFLSGNLRWHSDSSFKPIPAMASLLSAREVPPIGGETEFADMRAAYDLLDEEMKDQLATAEAEHDFLYSQSLINANLMTEQERDGLPPVVHPIVRTHPASGRKSIFIGIHAARIIGMPTEEGRALLATLLEDATRPQFVYSHRWQADDLVMWDNRCVLHRGRPWDSAAYRRIMHRTTVAGNGTDNSWAMAT